MNRHLTDEKFIELMSPPPGLPWTTRRGKGLNHLPVSEPIDVWCTRTTKAANNNEKQHRKDDQHGRI